MRVEKPSVVERKRQSLTMILHSTIDGDAFVKGIHRCTWMKQVGERLFATIFFCVLIWTLFVVASESNRPFFTMMRAKSPSTLVSYVNVTISPTDDDRSIKDAFIIETEAVKRFRSHLQCFSESGKWVYDPTPRHVPWNYIGDKHASICDRRLQGEGVISNELAEEIALRGAPGNWSVREQLKWVWQTNSSCPWHSIDRDNLCRKLGPRNPIMVVGDSLNQLIYWSLMNALVPVGRNGSGYEPLIHTTRIQVLPYEMCGDIFGEGNGFKPIFVRNDRLSPIFNATVDSRNNFYEFPWLDMLEEYGVKMLLLNRGAHYEDDEKYTNALREIFTILSRQFPHIHVIYRNTMPGQVDCMNFTSPLSEPQQGPSKHHWEDFDRQNHLAEKIVEEFHYTYMDVFPMLSLRADGHFSSKDCLHYCLPGPLDSVVEYLYNVLLLI